VTIERLCQIIGNLSVFTAIDSVLLRGVQSQPKRSHHKGHTPPPRSAKRINKQVYS
jgi:hypothetical protein